MAWQFFQSTEKLLVGMITGTDPQTGRILSEEEWARMIGGALGTLAGAVLLEYVGAAVGTSVGNFAGRYISQVVKGERCSWNPFRSCFAAGTPLRTPDGSKAIEELRPGDLVLSRDEHRPDGMVEPKVVEEVFVRFGRVLHLHVGGQVIATSAEHPFYAYNRGWVPAGSLAEGDRLLGERGEWIAVEEVFDTGDHATLYNLRIADWHTYFVGQESWGWAAWAHNRECTVSTEADSNGNPIHVLRDPDGNEITRGPNKDALVAQGKALDAERAGIEKTPGNTTRLIGISDKDAIALGKTLKGIEIDGKPAIDSVEAFGSRAGSTYRGRPPLPESDLDIYVTIKSDVANSPAKVREVNRAVDEICDLFSGAKKIKVNPTIEIDTISPTHKLQLDKTPFIRIDL